MTEVTTTCGKSLRVEKRDGARVQLMVRMRGAPSDMGFFFSIPLTLGTFGWRLDDPELESDETMKREMGYLRNLRMVDAICVLSHQG